MKTLTRFALVAALTALLPLAAQSQNIGFNIDNVDTTATSVPPSSGVPALNLSVSDLSRVNGGSASLVSNSSPSDYTGASGLNNVEASAASGALNIATSTYFTFTLTPTAGNNILVDSLSLGERSTASGPTSLTIFSSLDNFTTPVATFASPSDGKWHLYSVSTALISGENSPITFRIYGSGGSSASSGNFRLDDINIGYAAVPEPSVYMLLGIGLLICGQRFLRRKSA